MSEPASLTMWALFAAFVVGALAVDLGFFNRKAHTPTFRQSLAWCGAWFLLAMLFCGGLYLKSGQDAAASFLAGYLVELSLSVDNLFAFIMVFEFFKVQPKFQHRVLFWGIIGAVVLRAAFIFLGLQLIEHFAWTLYVMGAFLVFIGFKLAFKKEDQNEDFGNSTSIKFLKKIIPLSPTHQGENFFVKENGRWLGTPLLLVLAAVDVIDVIFAVDSIPAVLAVTRDSFVVFTSNIFAILGLRSMYFLISGVMTVFRFLQYGVSLILVFIGLKMLSVDYYRVPVAATLVIMVAILATAIFASILIPQTKKK